MDNFLLYLVQSYNVEAFDILIKKYFKYAMSWAKQLLKSLGYPSSYITNIEGDLFYNIYRAIESYEPKKGIFYSYLKKTVDFTVYGFIRVEQKKDISSLSLDYEIDEDILLLDIVSSDDNLSKIVERYCVLEEVEEFFDKLNLFNDDDKEVIRLKMIGYSNEEIIMMTGKNKRTVNYIFTKLKKM